MQLADDLLVPISDHPSTETQFRHYVAQSQLLSMSGDSEEGPFIFRVFIDLGVRWVYSDKKHKRKSAKGGIAKGNELGKIEALFVAEYDLAEIIPRDCLDEFALNNASYHVWPYWREFVANSCQRLDAPKVVLPVLQRAENCDSGKDPNNQKVVGSIKKGSKKKKDELPASRLKKRVKKS